MPRLVSFSVPGRPRGKERPRVAPGQQRPYTPASTVAAEKEVRALYLQARRQEDRRPLTGPVALTITAVFQIPSSWPKALRETAARGGLPYTGKPDRDNIEKLVCDALNGVAWMDDAQIVAGPVVKRFGLNQRTDVEVAEVVSALIPATPADKRREARVDAPPPPKPRRAPQPNRAKSKLPPALQRAVDRALAKERPQ